MSLEGQSNGTVYEDVPIDVGNKINPNLFIDDEEKHVYVMTPRKVRLIDHYSNSNITLTNGRWALLRTLSTGSHDLYTAIDRLGV